jgi:hypothetical protein
MVEIGLQAKSCLSNIVSLSPDRFYRAWYTTLQSLVTAGLTHMRSIRSPQVNATKDEAKKGIELIMRVTTICVAPLALVTVNSITVGCWLFGYT